MLLEKITEKQLKFMESWTNPYALTECLFHDFDNLGSFHKTKRGRLRLYQKPFLSRESLIDFDKTAEMHNLNEKEKFQLRINAGTIYNLGARKYGKTCVTLKLDISCSPIYDPGIWCALYSIDEKRLRGVLYAVKLAHEYHPVCRNWDVKCSYKPEIKFYSKRNHWLLQGINTTPKSKDPGAQFYQLHVKKLWGEEVSFETETIYKKRKEAISEDGVILRLAGMTDFTRHSPIGEVFMDRENKPFNVNYPQYVSPKWDVKEKKDRIKAYGDENNPDYLVFVGGEIVEDSYSVFDMDRIRECYNKERLKRFSIKKDQVENFRELIIIERPINANRIFVCQDVGDGSQSEILILAEIDNKYKWIYSITLFGLIADEQEEILHWIVETVQANVVAVDCGEALGRLLCDHLEKKYEKSNIVRYAGARKVRVGFEKDGKGNIKKDKKGNPIYKEEFMSEWSVTRLMTLLYGQLIIIPEDHKFDKQFTKVISGKFGDRRKYECIVENKDNHVWAAWRVFSIAQWLKKDFNKTKSIKKERALGVCSWIKSKE